LDHGTSEGLVVEGEGSSLVEDRGHLGVGVVVEETVYLGDDVGRGSA